MTNLLPETRQALEDVYAAEDPWHTRKIPEKQARYAALLRLASEWNVESALEISAGEGDFAGSFVLIRKGACRAISTAASVTCGAIT